MKKETFEELLKRVENLSVLSNEEDDYFYKKVILASKDELSIVLKSHLYLEFTIDKIISLAFPEPKEILKMKFSDKVKILGGLNFILIDKVTVEKIKVINTIRNKFSHKLDYRLTNEDILKLSKKPNDSCESLTKCFLREFSHIHGYIEAGIHLAILFPFLMNSVRNKKMFKNDKKFNYKMILESYKTDGLIEIVDKMKK